MLFYKISITSSSCSELYNGILIASLVLGRRSLDREMKIVTSHPTTGRHHLMIMMCVLGFRSVIDQVEGICIVSSVNFVG